MEREQQYKIVVRGHASPYFFWAVDSDAAVSQLFDKLESYDVDVKSVEEVGRVRV